MIVTDYEAIYATFIEVKEVKEEQEYVVISEQTEGKVIEYGAD